MPTDLSESHGPIDPGFSGASAAGVEATSQASSTAYAEQGFITGIPILAEAQINELRSEMARLMRPEQASNPLFYEYHHNESADPGTVLFHALGAWRVSRAFHDLIFLPSLVRTAETLLGGPVRLWHDQVFVKPPRDGAVVEWHQDYSYWTRTKPVAHLTCWIGLDDSTEDNGCVRYVPGSHRWDLLPRYHLSKGMSEVFNYLTDEQRSAFDPVPAILKAGEASFHHPFVLHGSYENTSDRPRRAAVINFIRDGVYSDSDEPLLAGVPVIPRGEKIEGRFFPLLSSQNGGRFLENDING
ncbi:MAG: phytanoyl-CoA dioxygenase family protein [Chloracidobacterium sp.]|nr:phytanoyl-CoA dioxygenase family protein [Chloracidobacterium sp.]